MNMETKCELTDWMDELRRDEDFKIEHIPLADSRQWQWRDGAIRHATGRFFSVVGVEAVEPDGKSVSQPMLDQREIGTLGLIVRKKEGKAEVLVQAKAEPGNIGLFQLAPSCQATASNAACLHGGAPPPMAEYFLQNHPCEMVADSLQSEQGTRFFGKRNRNCTLRVLGDIRPGKYHRWVEARTLLSRLASDHMMNTDIRSTLLVSDWNLLSNGEPFGGGGFAEILQASYLLPDLHAWQPLERVRAKLIQAPQWKSRPAIVPLESVPGWQAAAESLDAVGGGPFSVRFIQVRSLSREVSDWDQPIVSSAGQGEIILPMGFYQSQAHFLFKIVCEPGFVNRFELTPACVIEPGGFPDAADPGVCMSASGKPIVSCLQSEEGGRFLFDENRYALSDVGSLQDVPENYHWLTLGQIKTLLDEGERFTNEARSVLSLLLCWL